LRTLAQATVALPDVSIRLTPEGENFRVEVTPPYAEAWCSEAPLTATEVLEVLSGMGCHPTDITDAADSGWRDRHDADVEHRRAQGA
jgi:hypothetical protein